MAKMKKLLITSGIVAVICFLAGFAVAKEVEQSCGYDPVTGYWTDGKNIYAYGPWENAMECAMQGLLPEIKYTYKGLFGGTSEEVLGTNSVAKAAKEAEEKAKAEANK